jgi:hypothetical protein
MQCSPEYQRQRWPTTASVPVGPDRTAWSQLEPLVVILWRSACFYAVHPTLCMTTSDCMSGCVELSHLRTDYRQTKKHGPRQIKKARNLVAEGANPGANSLRVDERKSVRVEQACAYHSFSAQSGNGLTPALARARYRHAREQQVFHDPERKHERDRDGCYQRDNERAGKKAPLSAFLSSVAGVPVRRR